MKMNTIQIELIEIEKVKTNPNNPRIIKDDKFKKLVKSIQEFPKMLEIRPIVVNDQMIVLGGNMRLKACIEAGLKKIHVIKANTLSEEQQKEFIIKDNVGFGEWDWDDIAENWDAEQLTDWGLDINNFKLIDENEQIDLSDKIKSQFKIEVICKDENEQEQTYNKLIEQNYQCRLLTL